MATGSDVGHPPPCVVPRHARARRQPPQDLAPRQRRARFASRRPWQFRCLSPCVNRRPRLRTAMTQVLRPRRAKGQVVRPAAS